MKTWIIGAALAAATALCAPLAPTFADQAPPPNPAEQQPANVVGMPAANWLFVQTGQSYTSDGKTLTIHGVNPQTLMFSDRPQRMTGDAPTAKFVGFWSQGKDDFQKDPPNATLSDGKSDTAVVELSNPRLSGADLTYDIKTISGAVPASGDNPSLFIDWWYGPGWSGWVVHEPYPGGRCWVGYNGFLHCRPWWAY